MPFRIGNRHHIGYTQDPLNDIVDIGKVTAQLAIVVNIDWLTSQHGLGEFEQRHIGAPPRAIDGKETQASGRDTIQMRIGMRHQLIGLLRCRIERDWVIDGILGGKRHFTVHAINRAGRGIDQMLDTMMAAPFKNGQMPHQVTVGISKGVFQGIAHSGLRRQMDYPIKLLLGKQLGHPFTIGQIKFAKIKIDLTRQPGKTPLFQ
ncbi:hypothetical protein D3C73_1113140 [compost metagenome]